MANQIARRLRKRMTPQEVKLWVHLRPLRKGNPAWKFRRQVPLRGYIVDFACFDARLIIEIDGSQHGHAEHAARDKARDETLERNGFCVLRFWNQEIDRDFDRVLSEIIEQLHYADLRKQYGMDEEDPSSPLMGEVAARGAC